MPAACWFAGRGWQGVRNRFTPCHFSSFSSAPPFGLAPQRRLTRAPWVFPPVHRSRSGLGAEAGSRRRPQPGGATWTLATRRRHPQAGARRSREHSRSAPRRASSRATASSAFERGEAEAELHYEFVPGIADDEGREPFFCYWMLRARPPRTAMRTAAASTSREALWHTRSARRRRRDPAAGASP